MVDRSGAEEMRLTVVRRQWDDYCLVCAHNHWQSFKSLTDIHCWEDCGWLHVAYLMIEQPIINNKINRTNSVETRTSWKPSVQWRRLQIMTGRLERFFSSNNQTNTSCPVASKCAFYIDLRANANIYMSGEAFGWYTYRRRWVTSFKWYRYIRYGGSIRYVHSLKP